MTGMQMEIIHVGAGALVGFVIGLTGVGGGSLMTPILLLGFGIPPAIAVGTDLLYAAITKCSGIFFHHKNKTVDWKIVGLLASGSIPASITTVAILEYLNQSGKSTDQLMMLTLSSMLVLTGVDFSRPNGFGREKVEHKTWRKTGYPRFWPNLGQIWGVLENGQNLLKFGQILQKMAIFDKIRFLAKWPKSRFCTQKHTEKLARWAKSPKP